MSFLPALFGTYIPAGDPTAADCVMGHSFGTDTSPNGVNRQIVDQMKLYAAGRPLIADRMLVQADPEGEVPYAYIIDGQITKIGGQSGTGKALRNAQQYMGAHNLSKPLMIAHSYHIDRAVRQAAKMGIESIVPAGLPRQFDTSSQQFWTRSALLFVPANLLAYAKLTIDGDI